MAQEGSKLGAGHPHHASAPPRTWGSVLAQLGKETAPPSPLHPLPAGAQSPLHSEEKELSVTVETDTALSRREQKSRSGSETRQRNHAVRVRLDDAEREALEARAGELSLAAYMRASSFGDAGPRARRRAPVDRDLLARTNAEINRVGSNLNQISRTLNIAALDKDDRELAKTIGELSAPIAAAVAEVSATLSAIRRALGYDSQG
jgi:hypothetical protein